MTTFLQQLADKINAHLQPRHLSEEEARHWTSVMRPAAHYSWDKAKDLYHSYDLKCDFNDFYAVVNMLRSDYYEAIGDDTHMYVTLAEDWLHDSDATESKTYLYYKYIISGDFSTI